MSNRKNSLIGLLFLGIVLTLVGCRHPAPISDDVETQSSCADETVMTNVYSVEKGDDGFYYYQVFDSNNGVICSGKTWKEPEISMINDELLYFSHYEGPTKSCLQGFFYDYTTDTKSEDYTWILDFSEDYVVLGKPDRIIIPSIFGDSYCEEITSFRYPIARVSDGILAAELVSNGNAIDVTYISADTYEPFLETIRLSAKTGDGSLS